MRLYEKISPAARLHIKILSVWLKTLFSGDIFRFISKNDSRKALPVQHSISQRIMPNEYFDNKIENLIIAMNAINYLVIPIGKIFSFNYIVGHPTRENGFKESRSIKNGQVVAEIGGGLCQLPWIMYHLCLHCGIHIEERHHHSRDIYDETTRFAPLGSDATIVYAYKDFKIKNNFDTDICFFFEIKEDILLCSICSDKKLPYHDVAFQYENQPGTIKVSTYINQSLYKEDRYLL